MTTRIVVAASLIAAAWTCQAASLDRVSEVRLHGLYTSGGGDVTTTYTNDVGEFLNFDEAEADYVYRAGGTIIGSVGEITGFGAPLFGVGFTSFQSRVTELRTASGAVDLNSDSIPDPATITDDTNIEITGSIFTFCAGWGWSIIPGLHLEALGHFGIGSMVASEQFAIADVSTGDVVATEFRSQGNGNYYELGLEGGLYYTAHNGFQLGVAVGFLQGQGENTITETDGTDLDDNTFWAPADGSRYQEEFELSAGYAKVSVGLRW